MWTMQMRILINAIVLIGVARGNAIFQYLFTLIGNAQ